MWWSKALLVVAALGLSGCGFRPMYGTLQDSAGIGPELAQVRVLAISDRLGQQLRNALVQQLSPAGEPVAHRHEIEVTYSTSLEGLGFQKDAEATLGRLSIIASYTLRETGGNRRSSGTSRSVVSFNYLGPRYGSVAHERDAEERAVQDIAQDIRRQLGAYFARTRAQP